MTSEHDKKILYGLMVKAQKEMLAQYELVDGPNGMFVRGVRGVALARAEAKMDRLEQAFDRARERYNQA